MIHKDDAVLVTGSSGFIGKSLLKRLSQEGKVVVSLYRKHLPEPQPNIYPVCSDMESEDLMIAPLRGVHTVIHLAWSNNLKGYENTNSQQMDNVVFTPNLRILHNLIHAMERIHTKRIIFLSFLGVNKKAEHLFLKEKYLAEFLIINSKIPEKIILRLPLIYSLNSNDMFLNSFISLIKFPLICPIPCYKNQQISLIFLEDVIEILIKLIDVELKYQKTCIVDIVGDNILKIKDIISLISKVYYKKKKIIVNHKIGSLLFRLFSYFYSSKTEMRLTINDYCGFTFNVDNNMLKENELYSTVLQNISYTHFIDQLSSFHNPLFKS